MRLNHDISLYTVGNMLSSATLFSEQRWHRSQAAVCGGSTPDMACPCAWHRGFPSRTAAAAPAALFGRIWCYL